MPSLQFFFLGYLMLRKRHRFNFEASLIFFLMTKFL